MVSPTALLTGLHCGLNWNSGQIAGAEGASVTLSCTPQPGERCDKMGP